MRWLGYVVIAVFAFLAGIGWAGRRSSLCKEQAVSSPKTSLDTMAQAIPIDTFWVGSNEFILFDTQVVDVYYRAGFDQSFEDFKVHVYHGKKTPPDLRSHPFARRYKTMITNGYQDTLGRFAGHYMLTFWRCGAPCLDFAVVDVQTGKVYPGISSTSGYDFRPNSRLLIVDPSSTGNDWYSPFQRFAGLAPTYYEWTGSRFKQLK